MSNLPDEEIERLSTRAEKGYTLDQLRKRPKMHELYGIVVTDRGREWCVDSAEEAEEMYNKWTERGEKVGIFINVQENAGALEAIEVLGDNIWEDRAPDGSGFAINKRSDGLRLMIYGLNEIMESRPLSQDKIFGLQLALNDWERNAFEES